MAQVSADPTILEQIALQRPQGRLQDLADFVVPDSVLTHEHNCVEFVLGGIKLAQQAAVSHSPIQQVRCRGEVFFYVGHPDNILQKLLSLPDIPPPPDPHPDEGWDEGNDWDEP